MKHISHLITGLTVIVLWVLLLFLKWFFSLEYYSKFPTKREQRAYYVRYTLRNNIQHKIRERKEAHEFTLSRRIIRKINNLVYEHLDPDDTELRTTRLQSVHVTKKDGTYFITYDFSSEFLEIDDCCWWGFHKSWDIFTDAGEVFFYDRLDRSVRTYDITNLVNGEEIKIVY